MLEGDKVLTEITCCLCLNDEESAFSANTIMKSLPLHEMVEIVIGVQLTDAQSYHKFYNLSTICNECVLNVNNFYAFKQKILTAQKALAHCVDVEAQNEDDMFDLRNNEMHSTFEDLEADPSMQAEMDTMQNQEDGRGTDGQTTTNDGDKAVISEDEVEYLLLREPDPEASYGSGKSTEPAGQSPLKIRKIEHLPVKRRNPSKRKKVEYSVVAEKVAVQVNECLICPAVLSDILELNEHTAAHPSIDCKVCKVQFKRYANLKRHFVTAHSKPKPFVCDLCGMGFSFSVNLQTHASLHYSGKIQMKNTNK